jgi:hypothetical protein
VTEPEDWPFDQGRKVAAISDVSVVRRAAPVLLVIHYSDDHSWAFLSGGVFTPADGMIVGMGEAFARDATLRSIADLPPGWTATRACIGEEWVRREDPDT